MSALRAFIVLAIAACWHLCALAQWTFVSSPKFPEGETENGAAYVTQFRLQNSGRSYAVGEIVDLHTASILYQFGVSFPYVYAFDVLNNATGKLDPALHAENAALPGMSPTPLEVGIAGNGATLTATLNMTGKQDMYVECAGMEGPYSPSIRCSGYPGTTQNYVVRWSIWDSNCSLAMSNSVWDERCLVARVVSPVSPNVFWLDRNTTAAGQTVAANDNAPGFAAVASPQTVGATPPTVSTSCSTGRAAKNITYMLQMMGSASVNTGYCN